MEYCMTKECVEEYLDKLEESIAEYMAMPVNVRSTEAIDSMIECWERIKSMHKMIWPGDEEEADEDGEDCLLTEEDAASWNRAMKNADGTTGGHWLISDTSGLGRPDDVPEWEWNVTMNMMYSDYSEVAAKYGVGAARFYADMARAFLDDRDAGEDKLAKYYHYIVK